VTGAGSRRLVLEATLLHLAVAVVVGVAWWQVVPTITYVVVDGQPFARGEAVYGSIFTGDATFTLLGVAAGLLCAATLLLRGYRGVRVVLMLAGGGAAGSMLAWLLAVQLGPGRLDTLVAATADGEVTPGPELNAYAALLVWPIVAVAVVLVVAVLSAPERRPAPSRPT
jgi:hypothetical protein